MLISDDAYFSFFPFYQHFLNLAERGKCFGVDEWTLKKWPTLKNSATLIHFPPRQEAVDAYLQRRRFPAGEYAIKNYPRCARLVVSTVESIVHEKQMQLSV